MATTKGEFGIFVNDLIDFGGGGDQKELLLLICCRQWQQQREILENLCMIYFILESICCLKQPKSVEMTEAKLDCQNVTDTGRRSLWEMCVE